MSNPFFSIVIPAHNAENRIRKLLDSIARQTFQDYELIIVCDNCTDKTYDIACEYVRPDAFDDVFEVNYGSDGLTRDYGLRHASGKWILFADDDDWYQYDDAFEVLYRFIDTQPDTVDLISFGYIKGSYGEIKPTKENILKPRIDHVWSSAWRRTRIGVARFGGAVFCSDTYFMKAMRDNIRQSTILDAPLYYYNFMRPGSQTDLFCKGIIRQSPVAE